MKMPSSAFASNFDLGIHCNAGFGHDLRIHVLAIVCDVVLHFFLVLFVGLVVHLLDGLNGLSSLCFHVYDLNFGRVLIYIGFGFLTICLNWNI